MLTFISRFAPETTTIHAHRIAHRIEEKIMNEIPGIIEVMIHTEPFPDDDEDISYRQGLRAVWPHLIYNKSKSVLWSITKMHNI